MTNGIFLAFICSDATVRIEGVKPGKLNLDLTLGRKKVTHGLVRFFNLHLSRKEEGWKWSSPEFRSAVAAL